MRRTVSSASQQAQADSWTARRHQGRGRVKLRPLRRRSRGGGRQYGRLASIRGARTPKEGSDARRDPGADSPGDAGP